MSVKVYLLIFPVFLVTEAGLCPPLGKGPLSCTVVPQGNGTIGNLDMQIHAFVLLLTSVKVLINATTIKKGSDFFFFYFVWT